MNSSNNREWLENNVQMRMDANVDYLPEQRREFHKARYRFAKKLVESKTVLDGACGTGYGSAILAEVATKVVGIDLDAAAVEYAQNKYSSDVCEFHKSLVELTNFPDATFDVVVSFETVEHTLCPDSHFREMVRLLKDDGMAIVSIPNGWGLTDHHFFDFDKAMLSNYVEKYFDKIEYFYNNSNEVMKENDGIGALDEKNITFVECILAVCTKPKNLIVSDNATRISMVFDEVYINTFSRHNEYIKLRRKIFSVNIYPLAKRILNFLRRKIT